MVKGEAYHILPGVNPNCPSFLLFLSLAQMLSSWIDFNFWCQFHCSHCKLFSILLCRSSWDHELCPELDSSSMWTGPKHAAKSAFLSMSAHSAACREYRPTLLTAEFRGPPLFPRSEVQNFTWVLQCPFDSVYLVLLSGWGDLAELPLLRKNLDASCSCSASFHFWVL